MKLHLDNTIVECTPEELVEYLRLVKEEEKPMGYTFWYLYDDEYNKFVVLKTTIDGYFETSMGKRYYQHTLSDLVKPIDNVDAREQFENAENKGALLKYYPRLDMFEINY